MDSYRVLRTFPGVNVIRRGQVIEDPNWQNLGSLVRQGYLEKIDGADRVASKPAANPVEPPVESQTVEEIVEEAVEAITETEEPEAVEEKSEGFIPDDLVEQAEPVKKSTKEKKNAK